MNGQFEDGLRRILLIETRNSFRGFIYNRIGPIYLHTCGPVFHCPDLLKELPGLQAFETAFIEPRSTTTSNIAKIMEKIEDDLIMGVFGVPSDESTSEPVQDFDNFNRDWLTQINSKGVLMHAYGSLEHGQKILKKIGR